MECNRIAWPFALCERLCYTVFFCEKIVVNFEKICQKTQYFVKVSRHLNRNLVKSCIRVIVIIEVCKGKNDYPA